MPDTTKAPEAKAPEAEAPEAKAPEAKAPEAKAPEAKAPEGAGHEATAPETKAPETTVPEAEAPEAKAALVDGGQAASELPAAAQTPAAPEPKPATYHDQISPIVFRVGARGMTAAERAREATHALESALDDRSDDEEKTVAVVVEGDVAEVRIGNDLVTTYYPSDAEAEGVVLSQLAARTETELEAFVPSQLRRKALQLFTLHVFLSVFALVLMVLALRGLRMVFNGWDRSLDEKRGALPPIAILRIPVISGEALGGALALGLSVGRVTAYIATVVAGLASVLGQFQATRPLLGRLSRWSVHPILDGVEAVITALPGIALAALLVFGVRAGLRVMNLILDGVESGQIEWKRLPRGRVLLFRRAAVLVAVIIIAPLTVAAAFGRFGTPLESLALGATGVVFVASVPVVAQYMLGFVVLWTGKIKPGDWVQMGETEGEVTDVNLSEVRLVPDGGGIIVVPHLFLLVRPMRRLHGPPAVSFEIEIARDRPAKELIAALTETVQKSVAEAQVECVDVGHAWLKFRVSAPSVRAGVRQSMLVAVSDAADDEAFILRRMLSSRSEHS